MIKFVDSSDFDLNGVCSDDVFGTRILAYYNTYGAEFDFFKLWVQLAGDEITAAVCLIDGSATLTCRDNADFDELSAFLRMVGFATLQAELGAAQKLGFHRSVNGYIVRYTGQTAPEKYADLSLQRNVDYQKIYSLIKSAGLIGVGEYLPWLSDVTYRVKKGTAKAAVAEIDGEACACAMQLFVTDKATLLGAVATDPQKRGRGLGGALVRMLADESFSSGRRTELLCKNDSIVDFYRSNGFGVVGEWAVCENSEEK